MAFIKGKTIPGKIFIPEFISDMSKKHPCPDCFACQLCSDDRCALCRGQPVNDGKGDETMTEDQKRRNAVQSRENDLC